MSGNPKRIRPDRRANAGVSPRSKRQRRGQGGGGGSQRRTTNVDVHDEDGVRLQKLLAAAGLGSRRTCEDLISQGRVEVDGQIVLEQGVRIDPAKHVVHVDGIRVQTSDKQVYLALNKPLGVVSTMNDEHDRPSLADFVGGRQQRLFHVGRLDADTEGLLLLTNDGDLAHRLQHPSYGVPKTYVATVNGQVKKGVGRQLREGVALEDGTTRADDFRVIDAIPGKSVVELVLHEGRKHVVRRMLDAVGHPVLQLARTQVGPITLGDLRVGKTRALSRHEVDALYRAAEEGAESGSKGRPRGER